LEADSQLLKKFRAFHETCLPFVRIMSKMNPVIFHPIFLRSSLILSSPLRLGLPSGLFPLGFPTKILYPLLISTIRATFRAHSILLYLITLIISGEAYKLRSSSLCIFNLCSSPYCERPGSTPIQNNRSDYSFIYINIWTPG
jgi:hypothetical protein